MIGRRRRHLSQASYQLIQEIHETASRIRQADAGLTYRRHAVERPAIGEARPLHIGPQLDMVRGGNGFEAA